MQFLSRYLSRYPVSPQAWQKAWHKEAENYLNKGLLAEGVGQLVEKIVMEDWHREFDTMKKEFAESQNEKQEHFANAWEDRIRVGFSEICSS